MFGLPKQTAEDGLYDLQTAISLAPTHISWYQLTLEPHTAFYHNPPSLPADDAIWDLQLKGQSLLAKHGYQHYEISAYAQANQQCHHNRNYWLFGDYLGIGAGAHGKITDFTTQEIIRRWNKKHPKTYLHSEKSVLGGEQKISIAERPLEFMINILRLQQATPLSLYEERTGLTVESIVKPLNLAQEQNLLIWDCQKMQPTQKGYRYLNELLALF